MTAETKQLPQYVYVCPYCHGDAFYIDYVPVRGHRVMWKDITDLEGNPVNPNADRKCYSCHNTLPILTPGQVTEREDG